MMVQKLRAMETLKSKHFFVSTCPIFADPVTISICNRTDGYGIRD